MKYILFTVAVGVMLVSPGYTRGTPKTLILGPDLISSSTVNGKPIRIQVNLTAERTLIVNAEAAGRIGLKTTSSRAKGVIGHQRFSASSTSAEYEIGGMPIKRRLVWYDTIATPGADAVVGPAGVAQDVITIQLRLAQEGERTYTLPLIAVQEEYGRMGTILKIGDQAVAVGWSLNRDSTLVTAAAAADLANSNGGHFTGEKRQDRVVFDVQRPVRTMEITSPFAIGPIHLSQVTAWVGDYGDTSRVPDDQDDPNEIVVTAKGSKIKSFHAIVIGRNDMAHCSSITYDKPGRQIRLVCR
jgi:hypothetical protein